MRAMTPDTLHRVRTLLNSQTLWVALWGAPLWTSVFGRVLKNHTPLFVDYGSIVCAAERLGAGLPLYGHEATCPRIAMSSYVYPPWVAKAFTAPLHLVGEAGTLAVYGMLFLTAFAFLLWAGFWRLAPARGRPEAPARRAAAPFLAFVGGSPLVVGNVAIIAQAAVVAGALYLGADSVALVGLIVAASLIKPIYLTYLVIPAFAPDRAWRRWAMIAAAAAIVAGLVLSNLPDMDAWRAYVIGAAVDPNPGGGLLRWLGDLGVNDHRVLAVVYLAYAALLFGAGLAIAHRGGLDAEQRMWLGVTVAVLLLPRVVAYDLLILGPGLMAAAVAAHRLSARASARLSGIWLVACLVNLVASLGGGGLRTGHSLALMLLAGGLLWLGAALTRSRRPEAAPVVRGATRGDLRDPAPRRP